ncbi:MAG TPA: hypothetical protein DEQ43_25520 [Nocardioides bacterium]|jgi:DNA replication protein DnaC|uniref:ATP-binding protein n=1 Tax=uncultured Nocardioides sp. TaxID=198441 RepID=UPI000EE85510|nr:ATP-binding protein [uncultured Nocardioides sp.]HCB07570.1 hypothetical protein [Nocardioides sp.]
MTTTTRMHPSLALALRALEDVPDSPFKPTPEAVIDYWGRWMERSVPPIYRDASLPRLTGDQKPAELTRWIEDTTARVLWLVGAPGTGKTYAAYAVAAHMAAGNGLVRATLGGAPSAWTLAGLLDDMRPQAGDPEGAFKAAKEAPLLVLDDLAHTQATAWAVERLWMLADYRTTHDLRTILTTNTTSGRLAEAWGEAAIDRFLDRAVIVKMTGQSRRGLAW